MGNAAIVDSTGADLSAIIEKTALDLAIPPELILACGIAESSLNPRAERWGSAELNEQALEAIVAQDWETLQTVINAAWADISFGIAQRVVKYHWSGDHTQSWQNCMAVREAVFHDRDRDIAEMGRFLHTHFFNTVNADLRRTGGDPDLMALVAYNAGHIPAYDDPYWTARRSTIERYAKALGEARALYFALPEEEAPTVTEPTPESNEPPRIEGFIALHPEQAIWTADGSPGEPVVFNERYRVATSATHVLHEFDGWVSPVPIDMSFFDPPPQE